MPDPRLALTQSSVPLSVLVQRLVDDVQILDEWIDDATEAGQVRADDVIELVNAIWLARKCCQAMREVVADRERRDAPSVGGAR